MGGDADVAPVHAPQGDTTATLLPPPTPDVQGTERHRRRWSSPGIAAALAVTALLAGAAGGGIVAALDDGDPAALTTPVAQPTTTNTADTSGASDATTVDASAIYDTASPGVVDITATGTGSSQPDPFGQGGGSTGATGSGFVLDTEGYIVTAAHVVDGADSLEVTFSDGTTRVAELVGKDDATDVAVIKVNSDGLTLHPLALGSDVG